MADGTLIDNVGEKRFIGVTEEGLKRRVVEQVCGGNKSVIGCQKGGW